MKKPCGSKACVSFVEQNGGDPESPSEWICTACGAEGPMYKFFSHSTGNKKEKRTAEGEVTFEPNLMRSICDILRSFDLKGEFNVLDCAFKSIYAFYGEEADVPNDVRNLKNMESLSAADYVLVADECQSCGDEQSAAGLYAAGYCVKDGTPKCGEAHVKLAELYTESEWPKNGGRECDVMKAVDLLTEALTLGCVKEAKEALEGMREQIIEEYEDEPDVDYFIRNYQADALCLAAFCLGVGIGWKKDVPSATRLYEAALAQGYERASYYLKEIRSGRV